NPLTFLGFSDGPVTLLDNGFYRVTPEFNYSGPLVLTYSIENGGGIPVSTTVTIDVQHVEHNPTAVDESFSMVEDHPIVITARGLLANDFDLDNQAISVTRIVATHNVSVSFDAAGPGVSDPNTAITITPDLNVNGPAWFDYEITDSTGRTAIARVNLSIAAVNDPPVIGDIPAFSGFEGQAFSATLPAGRVTAAA